MSEFFADPSTWSGWAFGVLCAVSVVSLVLTDRLVTKGRLKDVQGERDMWKEVAMEAMRQNGLLVDTQGTAKKFYSELLDKDAGPRIAGAKANTT